MTGDIKCRPELSFIGRGNSALAGLELLRSAVAPACRQTGIKPRINFSKEVVLMTNACLQFHSFS